MIFQADMDQPGEKRSRCQHDRPALESKAHLGYHAHYPIALKEKIIHRLLKEGQVGLIFQATAYRLLVEYSIGLRSRGTNSRAFAGVEDSKLNARLVGGYSHRPAKRVNFANQVPLSNPSN